MSFFSASYPGLDILSADMTLSHGVSPSVCHVIAVPDVPSIGVGELKFLLDEAVHFSFKDCAPVRSITTGPKLTKGIRIELDILDRRWRWRYREISGRYNQRDSAGFIIEGTAKTYRELIELTLGALGVTSYLIDLPESIPESPPIIWDHDRADLALAELTENIGCVVQLGQDDVVYITPIGTGALYEDEPNQYTPVLDFTPSNYPKEIAVTCGPTVYQHGLELEAVGMDYDGSVKPLKELSYFELVGGDIDGKYLPGTPGRIVFAAENTLKVEGDDVPASSYDKAIQTVYRWYRIKQLDGAGLTLPSGETVSSYEDFLPLRDRLVSPPYDGWSIELDESRVPGVKPYVYGNWWEPFSASLVETTFSQNFDLDLERGLVMFHDYVYGVNSGGYFEPATIYLMAAFSARKSETEGQYHQVYTHATGKDVAPDAGTAVVHRDDLYRVNITDTQWGSIPWTNEPQLALECEKVAKAYMGIYDNNPQAMVEWVGLMVFPTQGNILHKRWVVNHQTAHSYAGKNMEHPVQAPTWKERRIRELVSEEIPLC